MRNDAGRESKNKHDRRLSKIYILLVAVVVFAFIIIEALISVYSQIWAEEKRFYNTKWESFAVATIGKNVASRIYAGVDPSDSTIRIQQKIDRIAANRAIKKIAPDDIEAVVWLYKTHFLPEIIKQEKMREVDEAKKITKEIMPTIAEVLSRGGKLKARSAIVADLERHVVMVRFCDYMLRHGKEYYKEDFSHYRGIALEACYESAKAISLQKVRQYNMSSKDKAAIDVLASAYINLSNNVKTHERCNGLIAKKWRDISEKIQSDLFNSPNAELYQSDVMTAGTYSKIEKQYFAYNQQILKFIQTACEG